MKLTKARIPEFIGGQMTPRRFPPPSSVEDIGAAVDSATQKLAYVYFEDEPGRRSAARAPAIK